MSGGEPGGAGRPTEDDIRRELENPEPAPEDYGDYDETGDRFDDQPPPPDARLGADHGEIFPGSPVQALGKEGKTCWFIDREGQLVGTTQFQRNEILNFFGGARARRVLMENFPKYGKQPAEERDAGVPPPIVDINMTHLIEAMMRASSELGLFTATNRIRGPGFWRDDDGGLIYHAGNQILHRGEWVKPGVIEGRVYTAAAPAPPPASKARAGAAREVLECLSGWRFRRPDVDPMLTLGFIGVQMLGGALDWRPCGYITGDAAGGKSTLLKLLNHLQGGDAGQLLCTDTTEAGLRAVIGHSCLPVAVDEFEFDPSQPHRTAAIVRLVRSMASGGNVFRGTADQRGVQQKAYSSALFSSIIIPPLEAQDRQRMVVLDLDPHPPGAVAPDLPARKWRAIGAELRRRLIDRWEDFGPRLALFARALKERGNSGRAAETYGTILALADLMISDDEPVQDVIEGWADKLSSEDLQDAIDTDSNAVGMTTWLLSRRLDPFRRGEQFTVGQWIAAAADLNGAPEIFQQEGFGGDRLKKYNGTLGGYGLRVQGKGDEAQLLIANKTEIEGLAELFADSVWAKGGWRQAARRLDGAEAGKAATRFNYAHSRYVAIPFRALPGLLDAPERGPDGHGGLSPEDI